MIFEDFVLRGLLGGLGIALVTGPLGCFVVWRRRSYFGAALSHSALLGIALGFLLGINLTLGITVTCVILALIAAVLQKQKRLPEDALLGILAHAALALGLVAISFMERLRVDLLGYLFGDILSVTDIDLYWIYGGGIVVLGVLALIWRPLLAATVQEELARAEGVPEGVVRVVFMLLIALVIAIAMKIIGVLLIHALLMIPAAARPYARTPERMALLASLIGAAAVVLGLLASLQWDTPSGASVVAAAALLFALSSVGSGVLGRVEG
jgi:zinc transport system permease protein